MYWPDQTSPEQLTAPLNWATRRVTDHSSASSTSTSHSVLTAVNTLRTGAFTGGARDPNPLSARKNKVTEDILDSIESTPELLCNMSKGVLLGTAHYKILQRNRFELTFEDPSVEGIQDGGHNMLAIGMHMLRDVMEEAEWKRVKSWDDLMEVWPQYAQILADLSEEFDFLVPLETLVPASDDPETVEEFLTALVDICSASDLSPAGY